MAVVTENLPCRAPSTVLIVHRLPAQGKQAAAQSWRDRPSTVRPRDVPAGRLQTIINMRCSKASFRENRRRRPDRRDHKWARELTGSLAIRGGLPFNLNGMIWWCRGSGRLGFLYRISAACCDAARLAADKVIDFTPVQRLTWRANRRTERGRPAISPEHHWESVSWRNSWGWPPSQLITLDLQSCVRRWCRASR
jgi:hypothetical protein